MNQQNQISFTYKLKLDKHAIPVILWNMFPVVGVLFAGWKPESVFICYALETIVVGVFNVFKMIVVCYVGLRPEKVEHATFIGWSMIVFFIIHYFVFASFALSMFFSADTDQDEELFTVIANLLGQRYYNLALGAFVLNNVYSFINDFIANGTYTKRTINQQMIDPYARIVVQVFVVIFGGFIFALTGNGYPVLIIFVGLKIYLDLLLRNFPIEIIMGKNHEKSASVE